MSRSPTWHHPLLSLSHRSDIWYKKQTDLVQPGCCGAPGAPGALFQLWFLQTPTTTESTHQKSQHLQSIHQPTNPCCWEIITLKGTPGTEKICFDTDYRKLHHTSKFTHLSAHVSDNHKSTPSPHMHLQLPQKLKTVGLVLILHYVYN